MSRDFVISTLMDLIKQTENIGDALLWKRKIKPKHGSLIICGTGFQEIQTKHGLMSLIMLIALRSISHNNIGKEWPL